MKIDILKIQGNALIHKQYEHRNGRNYIRIKKRPLTMLHRHALGKKLFREGLFGA